MTSCAPRKASECDFVVFGGDLNSVCDVSKDKKEGVPTTNLKSEDEIEVIREDFELADIWRVLNPEATLFTWRRENPKSLSRSSHLYLYISDGVRHDVIQ